MSSGFSVFFAVLDSVLWRCCGCKMAVKTQDQCIQEQVQKHPVQPKLNSVHLKGACCPMCISQLTYTKLHSSQMNLLTLPKQFSVFSPPLLAWWWVPLSIIFFFYPDSTHPASTSSSPSNPVYTPVFSPTSEICAYLFIPDFLFLIP